jgi:transposase
MATTKYHTREAQRLSGMRLLEQGLGVNEVARRLDVAHSTVSGWKRRLEDGGMAAVKDRPRSGRPPKLDETQRQQLIEILKAGPLAAGFSNDHWTLKRVASVIERELGIHFHPNYVGDLLHAIGYSPQKPMRRARQRNEKEIEEFRNQTWPEIKKKGRPAMLSYYC